MMLILLRITLGELKREMKEANGQPSALNSKHHFLKQRKEWKIISIQNNHWLSVDLCISNIHETEQRDQ